MSHGRLLIALALPLTLVFGACSDAPVAPESAPDHVSLQQHGNRPPGSGIVLDNLTGVSLPLVGEVADLVIDKAVITNIGLVENLAGQIVGLEVTGTVSGLVSALGIELVDEQFTSTVAITSSGPGQCEVVTVDLGGLNIDRLQLVTVDVPEAEVSVEGSGAVGPLLCALGSVVGGVTRITRGLVNAIDFLL